jgi:hypothetical protein
LFCTSKGAKEKNIDKSEKRVWHRFPAFFNENAEEKEGRNYVQ